MFNYVNLYYLYLVSRLKDKLLIV